MGSGLASGHISSQEETDSFEASQKELADSVLEKARPMAERIGVSAELLHVPKCVPRNRDGRNGKNLEAAT
jgi:hypothetical protein